MAYWRKLTRNQRFIVTTGGYYDYKVNAEKTHRLVLTSEDREKQDQRRFNRSTDVARYNEERRAKSLAKNNSLANLQDALQDELDYERIWQVSAHLAYKVDRRVNWRSGDSWPYRILHFIRLYGIEDRKIDAAPCGYTEAVNMLNKVQAQIRVLRLAIQYRKKYYYE